MMMKSHNATRFSEINRNCDDPSFKPYQVQDIKKETQDFFFKQLKEEIKYEQLPSNAKFFQEPKAALDEEKKMKKKCLDLEFFLNEKNEKDLKAISEGNKSNYIASLYAYLELSKVVEWLKRLNNDPTNITCSILSLKAPTGVCEKIFLRGKPLNDLIRATVVANFLTFFQDLNEFCKGNDFDYWLDDEMNATGYKVIKVYIYKVNKSYKDKILPVEIQLQTSRHYEFLKGSKSHQSYVIERIQQFVACKEVYLNHKPPMSMEGVVKPFLTSEAILEADWKFYNNSGDFTGGFSKDNEKGSFKIPKAISQNGISADLNFSNAAADKHDNLKIINGNLFLTNWAYHWTEETFSTNQNYQVNVEAHIGENIWIAIGRDKEVWIGPNQGSKLTSWTIMLGQIMMIRTGMYFRYWKTDRRYKAPKGKQVNLEIKIQNKKINVIIDGKEDSVKVPYEHESFRIGILSWNAQEHTFIKNLKIKNL